MRALLLRSPLAGLLQVRLPLLPPLLLMVAQPRQPRVVDCLPQTQLVRLCPVAVVRPVVAFALLPLVPAPVHLVWLVVVTYLLATVRARRWARMQLPARLLPRAAPVRGLVRRPVRPVRNGLVECQPRHRRRRLVRPPLGAPLVAKLRPVPTLPFARDVVAPPVALAFEAVIPTPVVQPLVRLAAIAIRVAGLPIAVMLLTLVAWAVKRSLETCLPLLLLTAVRPVGPKAAATAQLRPLAELAPAVARFGSKAELRLIQAVDDLLVLPALRVALRKLLAGPLVALAGRLGFFRRLVLLAGSVVRVIPVMHVGHSTLLAALLVPVSRAARALNHQAWRLLPSLLRPLLASLVRPEPRVGRSLSLTIPLAFALLGLALRPPLQDRGYKKLP